MSFDYALCGWRLESALALPELPAWDGDNHAPEIVVALGEVPAMPDAVLRTPIVQVDPAGRIRFGIEDVADYLVEDGKRITIAPHRAIDSPDIRLFLLGAGFGMLCHQRGILPIHAAAIDVDGRAVLIAGRSGVGKSTMAAAFLRRGHRILSDDVAPLVFDDGRPRILPSLRRIRLWRDSARQAGWDTDALEPCREELAKYSRPTDGAEVGTALPPAALIHLNRSFGPEAAITLTPLRGLQAVDALRRQTYRFRSLTGLVTPAGAIERLGRAAPHIPRHYALLAPMRYAALDDTIDAIVATVRAG